MRQRIVRLVLVAGNLPLDERVVRQVLVQGLDHEVAIVVGVRPVVILLEAVALGEARQVEPMPAPSLAIVRAGEQSIDQSLVRVRRLSLTKASTSSGFGGSPIRSK